MGLWATCRIRYRHRSDRRVPGWTPPHCLPPSRKVNARYDLLFSPSNTPKSHKVKTSPQSWSSRHRAANKSQIPEVPPDGIGIEVKTTTHRVKRTRTSIMVYRWRLDTQFFSSAPLAPIWVFLAASFPDSAAAIPRFDVFDLRYWTAWLVSGDQIAASKIKREFTEATLRRLGIESFPLAELPSRFSV